MVGIISRRGEIRRKAQEFSLKIIDYHEKFIES